MGKKMKIIVLKLNWIEHRDLYFGDSTREKDRQLSTGALWRSTADKLVCQ